MEDKREYLFRGQTYNNKSWIWGSLIQCGHYTAAIYDPAYMGYNGEEVDPETIGQYTGYCACENERIFEDDIVEDWVSGHRFQVVFSDYGNWGLKAINIRLPEHEYETIDPSYASTTLRIMGNIYDNPELLKWS